MAIGIDEQLRFAQDSAFSNGWTVFEAPAVEKSLKFPELALGVSVEESMRGRVFFRRGTGGAATR